MNYDDIIKFSHPVHSHYEVHMLPHLRVYNKAEGSYISQKNNAIKIPTKKQIKYNLLKFYYECIHQETVAKNKEVKLIDINTPLTFENLEVVDKEKAKDKAVIVIKDQQETNYKSVKDASRATGVKVNLIRYCCDGLVKEVKSKNTWIMFKYA